jgi:hypothetical protein
MAFVDCSLWPSILPSPDHRQRVAFKYHHERAHPCSIVALLDAHERGVLTGELACKCGQVWKRVAGWWEVGEPLERGRPETNAMKRKGLHQPPLGTGARVSMRDAKRRRRDVTP